MIKCKQAMEDSVCGKVCCCLECEEKENCKDVCTELSDTRTAPFQVPDANVRYWLSTYGTKCRVDTHSVRLSPGGAET